MLTLRINGLDVQAEEWWAHLVSRGAQKMAIKTLTPHPERETSGWGQWLGSELEQ